MTVFSVIWFFWVHFFMYFAVALDIAISMNDRMRRRALRGVICRRLIRNIGPHGPAMLHIYLNISGTLIALALFIPRPEYSLVILALTWTVIFVWDIVDLITGGDDPAKRLKNRVKNTIKKFKLAPAPRPAFR